MTTINKYTMEIIPYSKKSFVIKGEYAYEHHHILKELGGVLNTDLKGGEGWIFPNAKRKVIERWFSAYKSIEGDMSTLKTSRDREKMADVISLFLDGDGNVREEFMKELNIHKNAQDNVCEEIAAKLLGSKHLLFFVAKLIEKRSHFINEYKAPITWWTNED